MKSSTDIFLKPEHLTPIRTLSLRAKHIVEGFISGMHRSPFHGFSSEFLEYRPYRTGEDAARIDWRTFARSDKNFVKLFEDETNLTASILLDCSGSMSFSSNTNWTKFEYGRTLAASLAWILIRQRDATGLTLFSSKAESVVRPGSTNTKLSEILIALQNAVPAQTTATANAINHIAVSMKRKGLAIVISDFFDDTQAILKSLRHLRFSGQDIMVLRILDPLELDFHEDADLRIRDLESGAIISLDAETARSHFNNRFTNETHVLVNGCRELGIDFTSISTAEPFAKALISVLEKRSRSV